MLVFVLVMRAHGSLRGLFVLCSGALSQQLQELREYQNQVHEQLAAASASSGSRSSPPRHYSDAESDHVDLDESADVFV